VRISPSGYYAARARPPPARAVRDAALEKQILRVCKDSKERYGAWKVWDQLNREGIAAARCTVERLMRDLGLRGVRRGGYQVRTTRPDPSQDRPEDLVNRDFAPDAPDRLWVAGFTFVSTWAGTADTAFVIDAFARLIAGWRTAASHGTDLVRDALVMAVTCRARQGVQVAGLTHHSDAGSEGGFNRSSQHLHVEVGEWGDREDGQLPGRPPVARREDRQRFWVAIARGISSEDAGIEAGVSPAVGTRWFRDSGGIRPVSLAPLSGRYLSLAEREEIAILRVRGCGVREIARRTGRAPSTISRELRRNAATRGGDTNGTGTPLATGANVGIGATVAPGGTATVESVTPAENPGSYEICWDMVNASGAYFSAEGGNEYCAPYTIQQYPPAINEQEPLPGTDVDSQTPELSASAVVPGGYPASPVFSYAFRILNGPNPGTATVVASSGWVADSGNSWAPAAGLTWGTTYYWQVTVSDAVPPPTVTGSGITWTTPISFVVGNATS
jgi:hypothetical protein